ncbi:hypothetical protein IJ596_07950, partial [bacterium]|nr:hypothetical protein [bacterium]
NTLAAENITNVLKEIPKGIIALKGEEIYQPNTLKLLAELDKLETFQYVIPVNCYEGMKYAPYGFFRDLITTVFSYATSQQLISSNDYSMFGAIGSADIVKDLLELKKQEIFGSTDELRNKYFETFVSMLQAIPNTLIYIENFDKIDSASLDILEQLFMHLDQLDISYMVSYDKDYSLHKKMHFLLSRPEYTEISLIPTPINNILASNAEFYGSLSSDFYFKRILKYAKGSTLYLDHAIQYLVESDVYELKDGKIEILNPQTTVIPGDFYQLIQRRLNLMKDEPELLQFLAMCVLLSPRIDIQTAQSLGFDDWNNIAEQLAQRGYMYFYNECIYFANYEVLYKALLNTLSTEEFSEISSKLLQRAFVEGMPSPIKALLYEHIETMHQESIYEWEKLANVSLSMGDFGAYINCSTNIIKTLDKYSEEWSQEELNKYKSSIYDNIANNVYEFNPEETREIFDKTLEDLHKSGNIPSFSDLSLKMLQGAIIHGEFSYALNLIHKVLNVTNNASINPSEHNFSLSLLLMTIIHIKVLFNTGSYKDCLDIGYNVLNVLDTPKINSIKFDIVTKEDFVNIIIEFIAYMAMSEIFTLKHNVKEILEVTSRLFGFVPAEYSIFIELEKLMHGEDILMSNVEKGNNLFSNLIYYIISAYTQFKDNPDSFAKEVYKTKILAKDTSMQFFETFADLLIAYSYMNKESYPKANAIVEGIAKEAKEKGMTQIVLIAGYLMSSIKIKEGRFDISFNMITNNNALLEKTNNHYEYLMLLNKINMYRTLTGLGEEEKANICLTQIQQFMYKYKINLSI